MHDGMGNRVGFAYLIAACTLRHHVTIAHVNLFADPVTRFEVGDLGGGFIEICQQRRKNIMLAAVLATTVLIVTMAIVVAIAVLLRSGHEHDTHTGKDS